MHELATGTIPMMKHLPYMSPQKSGEVKNSGHMERWGSLLFLRLLVGSLSSMLPFLRKAFHAIVRNST